MLKNRLFLLSQWSIVLSVIILLAGCGGSGGSGSVPTSEEVKGNGIFTTTSTLAPVEDTEIITEPDGSMIEVAKDEVFLLVRKDITEDQLTNILRNIEELGGKVIGSDADLMMAQIRTQDESSLIEAIKVLPGVIMVSYNPICTFYGITNQQGAELADLTMSLSAIGYPFEADLNAVTDTIIFPRDGGWWMDSINIKKAWEISTGSASVIMGIVDTGIKADQKILDSSRIKRFERLGTEIIDDDTTSAMDGHHGLWVTGFAAGFVDDPDHYYDESGTNVRGANPTSHVRMVDVGVPKKDRSGIITALTDVGQGIKTAIFHDARIINVSIAAGTKTCLTDDCRVRRQKNFRSSMIGALEAARDNNALIVFAAGNDDVKNDDDLFSDHMQDKDEYAALWKAHAVVVGASTNSPTLTDVSTFFPTYGKIFWGTRMGQVVDLLAPGDEIGFSQDGVDVIIPSRVGDGTSYAAPLVTGVGALIMSVPIDTLLSSETKYLLTSSAVATLDTKYSPNKHLDADAALRSAKLLEGIPLSDDLDIVTFTSKDQKISVNLPVNLPTSGLSAMDIMFLVDVSGSYYDDISTMKSQASAILTDLSSRGIDIQFGVASFCDFPIPPYGSPGDQAFQMFQTLTSDYTSVMSAINNLSTTSGNDGPEAQYEGLYQTASVAGWREGAFHLIILFTDAPFHDSLTEPGYPGMSSTSSLAALATKGIKVIGMSSGSAGTDLAYIVEETDGLLFELASNSAGITQAMSDMLEGVTASFNVAYQIIAGEEFIESITPITGFLDVLKGDSVTFTANLTNPKNPSKVQAYNVVLWVKANDSIISRIKIPIAIPQSNGEDG